MPLGTDSTYAIPGASLSKIQRWMAAKRASGQTVQPWELEAFYKAEMDAMAGQQVQNRSLSLQAARDAETVRQNNINAGLRADEISAGKTASYAQLGTTGLGLNYMMRDPTTGTTPLGDAARGIKNWVSPTTPTTVTPPVTTTAVPTYDYTGPAPNYSGGPESLSIPTTKPTPVGLDQTATAGEAAMGGATNAAGSAYGGANAGIDIGTESALAGSAEAGTGATAGTAAGTVGLAAGYATAALIAAKYGMPVLGKWLGAQNREEYKKDPSSNFFDQAANITAHEYKRPVEAGLESLGIPVPGEDTLAGKLLNPGVTIASWFGL